VDEALKGKKDEVAVYSTLIWGGGDGYRTLAWEALWLRMRMARGWGIQGMEKNRAFGGGLRKLASVVTATTTVMATKKRESNG